MHRLALTLSLALAAAIGAQPMLAQAQPLNLMLGQPVERNLAGGAPHSYRVGLEAGQFMFAVVKDGEAVYQRGFGPTAPPPDSRRLV